MYDTFLGGQKGLRDFKPGGVQAVPGATSRATSIGIVSAQALGQFHGVSCNILVAFVRRYVRVQTWITESMTPSKFVISLDFELFWGVCDTQTVAS